MVRALGGDVCAWRDGAAYTTMTEDEIDHIEKAYRDVVTSLSEGLLVRFNSGIAAGERETPELRVEVAGNNNVLLTQPPDRGVCDWEVKVDREGRLAVFSDANTEYPRWYANVVTIGVVGYSD